MDRKARYFLIISFFAFAAFLTVSYVSYDSADWPFDRTRSFREVANLSGPLGSLLAFAGFALWGRIFAWLLPAGLLLAALGLFAGRTRQTVRILIKTVLVVVLLAAFLSLIPVTADSAFLNGAVGRALGRLVAAVFGEIGASILLITCLLLVLLTEVGYVGGTALRVFRRLPALGDPVVAAVGKVRGMAGDRVGRVKEWLEAENEENRETESRGVEGAAGERHRWRRSPEPATEEAPPRFGEAAEPWEELAPDLTVKPAARTEMRSGAARETASGRDPARARGAARPIHIERRGIPVEKAELPPVSILKTEARLATAQSAEKLKEWSRVLEDKLLTYGIEGRVTGINQGPVVTTFEFEPSPGVKVKDIVSRSDDLALAMRARSLRLMAPIPGRAVVGIEIPNPEQETVYFYHVLKEIPERLRYSGIMIPIGVDAVGKPFSMNLCSSPHVLLAGTTGSGKSVTLNVFLASILFQYRPSDVRLLLIDPKMVEMAIYNKIPHLLHPVITDPREAVRVFGFLIGEMERRNDLLRRNGVKNIESFNSKVTLGRVESEADNEKLPYIVLVIDELADLVLTKGADFESLLSRLSNMARAVGIHMIVATQRPSVDIIDGKTKANFPTRIAFRVASKVDSRTILDIMGAEKLLGRGDMLFVDGKHPGAIRLHGAWLSEEELERLVAHWRQYEFEESRLELLEDAGDGGVPGGEKDELFEEAREIVLRYRQGSTSLLQRKLHVGYARAARLLDQLEHARVVGPPDGSKPREVLIHESESLSPNLDE